MTVSLRMTAVTSALLLVAVAAAQDLQVAPSRVQLDSARDSQRVLALVAKDGVTIGALPEATFEVLDPAVARVEAGPDGAVVRPAGDGATELIVRGMGAEVRVAVVVRDAGRTPPMSFANEIVPSLSAAGCNAGSCHGAAAGKNGFGLTLFGYDPERDHRAITRDLRGRRIDFVHPEQSLLLQKGTASASHQGGKRLQPGSANYGRILDWITQGAADDTATATKPTSIVLEPSGAVLTGIGRQLPFVVRALYSDGTDADVTGLTMWSSGNDGAATVEAGRLQTTGRGEAVVLARFSGLAAIARVRVHADAAAYEWSGPTPANFVDERVFAKLREAKAQLGEPCTDAAFLRRVTLDLCATLPGVEETRAFLADTSPDKRSRLVDALLERSEFAALQAASWADVLQVDDGTMEQKGAALLGRHLREAFAAKRPFDEVVRELITQDGASFTTPAVNFQLLARQPHLVAEKAAQVFLGVRLQCAQCHNHPFERWTMDDYYGFAAFFGQVGKKRGRDPYETVVWNRGEGEVRNLRNGKVSKPRLLGGEDLDAPAGADRRALLADWMLEPGNPFFARNVANRLWARMFGRGLVEPVDDVRIGNPASHPELLDELARLLVESRFEVRTVLAAIAKSRTYQSAAMAGDADPALFSGCAPRRLSAESLLDAISAVCGAPTKYPGVPLGEPATQVDGGIGNVGFLDAFGRPARESVCACDRRDEPTLGQTLHLINGATIAEKAASPTGRLRASLKLRRTGDELLDELFLAAYCRMPSDAERALLLAPFPAKDPKAALAAWEDIYWSVLNSKEFLFQH